LDGSVPTNPTSETVTIGANVNITTDIVLGDKLNVYSGSTLAITGTGSLTVGDDVVMTVDGELSGSTIDNFTIKSTANGTGNLMCSGIPLGTLECFISEDSWHLIGPPNSSYKAADYFLTGYMQTWADGDPQGEWTIHEDNPALTRAMGAAYYFYSNFTAGMYGTLEGDEITVESLGNETGDTGNDADGWHLLANPFPCGLDADKLSYSNNIGEVPTIYNGSSYVSNITDLAPSQGFFVQVAPGASNQSVTFPIDAKINKFANVLKEAKVDSDLLQLTLMDNAGKSNDQITIRFNEEATDEYDLKYDAHKMMGNPKAGEFMAQISETETVSLLGIPFPEETTTVVVNFKKGDESEYTMQLAENTMEHTEIVLEDTQTGFQVDLIQNPVYTFTADDDMAGRFLIHLRNTTGLSDMTETDHLRVWNHQQELYIQQDQPQAGFVYIYDISGKMVYSQAVAASELQKIPLNQPQGAYIIKLISGDKTYSQKIIK